MDFTFYLSLGAALLSAVIAVLVVVAPRTANTVDDAVLARLEELEDIVAGLGHSDPVPPLK